MRSVKRLRARRRCFSTLQRVEIAEIWVYITQLVSEQGFSTLQRVEIAEIRAIRSTIPLPYRVSVLFNESKLLKYRPPLPSAPLFQIPITTLRCS